MYSAFVTYVNSTFLTNLKPKKKRRGNRACIGLMFLYFTKIK